MSRKSAVLLMAILAMTSVLWVDAATAQAQFHKIGRPWEVDGVALPFIDEGAPSDRGEGTHNDDGYMRTRELRGPGSDTPERAAVEPKWAGAVPVRGSTAWIVRWWLSAISILHL